MLYGPMSLCVNDLQRPPRGKASFGGVLASNLAVVFQEASARRFGPSRADVVHYFSLRDDHVAETQKPDRNRRSASVGGSIRSCAYAQFACDPRLRESTGCEAENTADGALDRQG